MTLPHFPGGSAFSEEQIVNFPREAERAVAVKDLCRRHNRERS